MQCTNAVHCRVEVVGSYCPIAAEQNRDQSAWSHAEELPTLLGATLDLATLTFEDPRGVHRLHQPSLAVVEISDTYLMHDLLSTLLLFSPPDHRWTAT